MKRFDLFEDIDLTNEEREYFEVNKEASDIMIEIIKKRIELKIAKKDFAKMIGISQRQLLNYENFETTPKLDILIKMLRIVGLKLEIKKIRKVKCND